jgi:hypothetical protein
LIVLTPVVGIGEDVPDLHRGPAERHSAGQRIAVKGDRMFLCVLDKALG